MYILIDDCKHANLLSRYYFAIGILGCDIDLVQYLFDLECI